MLHELGHATVARATGLPIRGITLFIFGGVAELSEEPKTAGGEFVMAIAGPLVGADPRRPVLGAVPPRAAPGRPPAPLAVFHWLGIINWVLLAFNMIPGFPLDGGRVFRSILWGITGNLRQVHLVGVAGRPGLRLAPDRLGRCSPPSSSPDQRRVDGLWCSSSAVPQQRGQGRSYQQVLVRQRWAASRCGAS